MLVRDCRARRAGEDCLSPPELVVDDDRCSETGVRGFAGDRDLDFGVLGGGASDLSVTRGSAVEFVGICEVVTSIEARGKSGSIAHYSA